MNAKIPSELPKVVRVFISSTWLDLQHERLAVEKALQRLRETKFIGMEYFGSRDENTQHTSLGEVDHSEVYVGIFGGRYGSGITEAEYRRAQERHLPCFIYVKDQAAIDPQWQETDIDKVAHQKQLLAELLQHTITTFHTPEELASLVTADLHRWLFDTYLISHLEHVAQSQDAEKSTQVWNVPYARNHLFTGREDILTRLRTTLTSEEQPVALAQPQAISGLGGIGKTQIAVEYAYRYFDNYEAVLWVRADSHELLTSDFLAIASLLNLAERNEQDQSKIVNAVLRWLNTHEHWLLILDNADDLETVSKFIPSAGKGHVLLTTRAQATGTIAQRIEIEKMGIEEGTLFLLRRAKRLKEASLLEEASPTLRTQAQEIVELLDGLPLALDQAGAYIEETVCSLSDYLKFYKSRRNRLLQTRGSDTAGHPEPVATTWSLSFEKVKQSNPAAAELLYLLALLHPDNIPESMIVGGASALGPVLEPVVSDEFDFNEAIGELHKYSLIKRDPEEKILAIHRLVQAVIWDGMGEQEREQWVERSIVTLDIAFPEFTPDATHEVWERCESLLPHVLRCAAATASQKYSLQLASLLYKTASYLYERGQYEQAEPLFRRALQTHEQTLGLEHPDVATSLHGLATLYRVQGKYEQAEPLFQRALYIREQALGPVHPDVAASLHGLAVLYAMQGKYEQADPYLRHVLHIREQTLGPEHPQVAASLNNLAVIYAKQGKYEQAEPPYQRALHVREQALGPEHPQVAQSLNNLAVLYTKQGKYEQAEPLYQRALQIFEQALGSQHPNVAHSLDGLADLYREWGKYEQAESLYMHALKVWEWALGPEHSDMAFSLSGLAKLYYHWGRYEQAEPLYQRALHLRKQTLGLQHPETADTLHDFARFHEMRKQPEEALKLYLEALTIREQQLGPQHSHTIDTRTRAAQLLRESGRSEEAAALEATSQQVMEGDQIAR